jgi:hypothetical protein
MAIEMKELAQHPVFEGLGVFAYAREATETRKSAFVFESFGGQVSVEVEESEYLNPPVVGSLFQIVGTARRNNWNGTMSLLASGKRLVASSLTVEHTEAYTSGLVIRGVGKVESRSSSVVQRKTYSKATLSWVGAMHEFRSLPPEIYQRIPVAGSYVRFELGLQPLEVRNQDTGQIQIVHKPTLLGIRQDTFASGSVPSSAAASATASGAPLAAKPAASVPVKP